MDVYDRRAAAKQPDQRVCVNVGVVADRPLAVDLLERKLGVSPSPDRLRITNVEIALESLRKELP
jgi:hypothetical protein